MTATGRLSPTCLNPTVGIGWGQTHRYLLDTPGDANAFRQNSRKEEWRGCLASSVRSINAPKSPIQQLMQHGGTSSEQGTKSLPGEGLGNLWAHQCQFLSLRLCPLCPLFAGMAKLERLTTPLISDETIDDKTINATPRSLVNPVVGIHYE